MPLTAIPHGSGGSRTKPRGALGGGSGSKYRAPRWNIPPGALCVLEDLFRENQFPTVQARDRLASELIVKPRQIQVWFQNRRQRERNQQRKVLHNSGDISDALLGFCSGDEDDEEEEDDDDDDGEEGDRSRADGDGSADMMLDLGDAADLVASDDEDALTRCMDDDNADGLIVGSALSAGGDGGVGAAATAVARSDGGGDAGAGAQMHTPNTSAHGGGVPHTPHAAVPSAPALDELLRPLLPSSKLGCGAAVAASASVNYSTHSMRAALAPSQLHEGAPAVPVSRPTLCARGGLSASTDVAVAAERAAAAYAAAAAFAAGAPSCAPLALDSFCTLGLSSRRTTLETASGATFDGARSGCGGRGACWPSGLSAVLSTTPASGPSGLAELLQPGLDERQLGERRPTADSYAALDSRRSTELGSRRPTEWSACAPPAAALCAAPTVVDGFGGGGIEAGVEAMPPPTLPSKPQGASSAYWYHYWRQVTEGIAQLQQWAAAADAATEGGGGGSLGLAAAACGVDADGVDTGSGSIAALQAAAARFHASLAQPQPAGGSVAAVGGTGGGGVCAAAGGGVGAFAAAGGGIGAYAATGGVQSESYLGLPHFGFCEGLPASMQLGFAAHLSRPQLQPLQPPRTLDALTSVARAACSLAPAPPAPAPPAPAPERLRECDASEDEAAVVALDLDSLLADEPVALVLQRSVNGSSLAAFSNQTAAAAAHAQSTPAQPQPQPQPQPLSHPPLMQPPLAQQHEIEFDLGMLYDDEVDLADECAAFNVVAAH